MKPFYFYIALHIFSLDVDPPAVSRIVYSNRGFPLFWQDNANATCGYVLELHDASCIRDCPVEWIKVAAGITNVFFGSGMSALKSTTSVKKA